MTYTVTSYEACAPLLVEHPETLQAGVHTSAFVSLANYHRAHLDYLLGALEQGVTVDVSLLQATTAAGTDGKIITAKDGTTKMITQIDQSVSGDDHAVTIELQTEELDVDNGFEYVGVQITVANGTAAVAGILYGCEARFKPAPTTNWDEIVD